MPQTVCESVLTWSHGAARVLHANATIGRSLYQFKLQYASDRGGYHSAFLLLRRGRGGHAVVLDFAGLLSGSGCGITRKPGAARTLGAQGMVLIPLSGAGAGGFG